MDIRLCFPNEYLAAADLRGREVTLTISRLTVEELRTTDGGKKQKPVIYFVEMEQRHREGRGENKRLVLNKTNSGSIAKIYGHETDGWQGKRITLYPTTCLAFGDSVDCLRIREQAPPPKAGPKPEPAPESAPALTGDEAADIF